MRDATKNEVGSPKCFIHAGRQGKFTDGAILACEPLRREDRQRDKNSGGRDRFKKRIDTVSSDRHQTYFEMGVVGQQAENFMTGGPLPRKKKS